MNQELGAEGVKIRRISSLIPRLLLTEMSIRRNPNRRSQEHEQRKAAAAADELQFSVQYLQKSCDFPPLGNLHAHTHARAQTWISVRGTASRLHGRETGTGGRWTSRGRGQESSSD